MPLESQNISSVMKNPLERMEREFRKEGLGIERLSAGIVGAGDHKPCFMRHLWSGCNG